MTGSATRFSELSTFGQRLQVAVQDASSWAIAPGPTCVREQGCGCMRTCAHTVPEPRNSNKADRVHTSKQSQSAHFKASQSAHFKAVTECTLLGGKWPLH
eukprot:6212030-Pleurochrysis_carterae.AAC.2